MAEARPINESEGFEIVVTPKDGIRGNIMVIKSENTNHVRNSVLDIGVSYGQSDSYTIISESIEKLQSRGITSSSVSCKQYTN